MQSEVKQIQLRDTRYLELDYLRRDHQIFRVEERTERRPEIDTQTVSQALLGKRAAAIVVSDYGRGFITDNLCAAIAKAAGGPLILDPAGQWPLYRNLGDIHTVLIRTDQLVDLCSQEGIDIDPVSAVDRRAGVLLVLSRWPGVVNVVVKDHGTAETTLFYSRNDAGRRVVDVFGMKKLDQHLRTTLGGGTAFNAYMSASVGVGFSLLDSALVGECGALTMSLLERSGVPSLDDLFRFRNDTAALFRVEIEGTFEIAGGGPKRDYL